jgi:hypothetical protein
VRGLWEGEGRHQREREKGFTVERGRNLQGVTPQCRSGSCRRTLWWWAGLQELFSHPKLLGILPLARVRAAARAKRKDGS